MPFRNDDLPSLLDASLTALADYKLFVPFRRAVSRIRDRHTLPLIVQIRKVSLILPAAHQSQKIDRYASPSLTIVAQLTMLALQNLTRSVKVRKVVEGKEKELGRMKSSQRHVPNPWDEDHRCLSPVNLIPEPLRGMGSPHGGLPPIEVWTRYQRSVGISSLSRLL